MTWSPELLEYTRGRLLAREAAFGPRREEVSAALAACAGEERPLLAYYYATLPLTDVGDYSPAYFLSVARQALAVREEFPWCQALAEHRFLKDVAYPRVNTEELAPCRELFHDALAPRVRGLSLEEAILEVNRWCAEEATYRSTDGRTASPLQVYQRGFGRCGEESTFLVTALRSVGIAARQVYVPWWSHCDDNHAWVEAFDGQGWRYLGACEPEPQLDRGWFTHAAARAVMVHTRAFVQGSREEVAFLFPGTDPVDWDIQEGVAVENITARYGDTKRLTVQVAGPDGAPAAGAWVSLSVLNMAAPREIARRQADSQGRVTLGLGKGSVLATAWEEASPGLLAECLLAPEDIQAALVLGQGLAAAGEWDFLPPADAGLTVPALSPSQEEARRACLDRAAALREEKRLAREKARPAPPAGEGARVWQSLTEKDREGELSPQLLEDALAAFAWEGQYPAAAFQEGLLSPRVALEVLTPWRRLLEGRFSPQEREAARQEPSRLWQWAQAAAPVDKDCYAALWGTPQGMLQVGASTSQGQQVLFCAACRALGIPAKLVDGVPQVWREGWLLPPVGAGAHGGPHRNSPRRPRGPGGPELHPLPPGGRGLFAPHHRGGARRGKPAAAPAPGGVPPVDGEPPARRRPAGPVGGALLGPKRRQGGGAGLPGGGYPRYAGALPPAGLHLGGGGRRPVGGEGASGKGAPLGAVLFGGKPGAHRAPAGRAAGCRGRFEAGGHALVPGAAQPLPPGRPHLAEGPGGFALGHGVPVRFFHGHSGAGAAALPGPRPAAPGHFGQPAGRGPVRLLRLQRGHGPAAAAAGRRAEKP